MSKINSPLGMIFIGIVMYFFLVWFNEVTEEPTYKSVSTAYAESSTTESEITTAVSETVTDSVEEDTRELDLLAQLIYAEAGASWCDYKMKYLVGSVVINRVNSPLFPDNIYDVIYQKGQYECVINGHLNNIPTEECYEIARDLLTYGSTIPQDVLFQAEFKQGSSVYLKVQNMYFCYR